MGLAAHPSNVIAILTLDPRWKGVFAFDEFIGDITLATGETPLRGPLARPSTATADWTESDNTRLATWMAREYGLAVASTVAAEGLKAVAEVKRFHPVRQRLTSLKWDRQKRLDDFLIRLAGVEDSPYVRAVSSKWLISAVARIMEPGCQADSMLILEGEKGRGKTSLLRLLALEPAWLHETTFEIGTKDSYQALNRKWIVLFDEMDSVTRSQLSRVKQFITERYSSYRPSYARKTYDFPRQCVMAASTNDSEYLKEKDRRFWPVRIRQVDLAAAKLEITQLWAEAAARYNKKERWDITDEKIIAAQGEETDKRRQADPWEGPAAKWLSKLTPVEKMRGVTTHELLAGVLSKDLGDLTRGDEMRAAQVLRECGWGNVAREPNKGVRRYRPFDAAYLEVKLTPPTKAEKMASVTTLPTYPTLSKKLGINGTSKKQAQDQPTQPTQPISRESVKKNGSPSKER
jgi:putative DNA primase/helicase